VKGTTRIGGALAVGIIIIFGALSVSKTGSADMSGSVVVATAPERNYIESADSDGDGVKDWEEELGIMFTEVSLNTSSSTLPNQSTYTPPTTLTGKFSEAFFKDYLDGKVKGVDYSNPTEFISNAVTAVEKNTRSIKHSRLELTIVPSSFEAVAAYGNTLSALMAANASHEGSDIEIFQAALDKHDPTLLAPLKSILDMYTNTTREALAMQVPDSLADEHLAFLNACESLATDVYAMTIAFDDPLYAIARVQNYNEDYKALYASLKNISLTIKDAGVTYMNNEPGAFFYLFENLEI
jgi:hypothetical protein